MPSSLKTISRPPGKMRRRSGKSKPAPESASPKNWELLLGAAAGLGFSLVCSWFVVQTVVSLIDVVPKKSTELDWSDRLPSPVYIPAPPSTPAKPVPQTVEPPPKEAKPPKGRCGRDRDCRSSGLCLLEAQGVGICVECLTHSDCPGNFCSSDNVCVECTGSYQCPGSDICRDNRCIESLDTDPGWRY